MIEILLGLISVSITFILNFFFIRILCKQIENKVEGFSFVWLWIGLQSVTAIVLQNYVEIRSCLNILFALVLSVLVFKISFKRSLIYNLLFFGIYISVEFIVSLLLQQILSIRYDMIMNSEGAFLGELLCQSIIFIIIICFYVFLKRARFSWLDIKGWLAFTFFPVFSSVAMLVLLHICEKDMRSSTLLAYIFLGVGLLVLNLLMFYLLNNVISREHEINKKQALIEQSKQINRFYQSIADERKKQKSLAHDYLNHLNVMLVMAQTEKQGKIAQYITEQISKETQYLDLFETGNSVVNAIINIKYIEAERKGIRFPILSDDLSTISINNSDLVVILSNVIDNAIEAAEKTDDKFVQLKIKNIDDSLYIDEVNSVLPGTNEERFNTTSKEDNINHGYGLTNIKNTVEENNGKWFIEVVDNTFHITIIIPLH